MTVSRYAIFSAVGLSEDDIENMQTEDKKFNIGPFTALISKNEQAKISIY